MKEEDFWDLIDSVDTEALEEGDEEAAVSPLIDELAELSERRLQGFEEKLAKALYRLDGRKYAEAAGESGKSDDGFLYARCYVVGCGRKRYEQTLADPTMMPKSTDQWFEALLYAAAEAWAQSTGRDPEEWDYDADLDYETGSNQEGWA